MIKDDEKGHELISKIGHTEWAYQSFTFGILVPEKGFITVYLEDEERAEILGLVSSDVKKGVGSFLLKKAEEEIKRRGRIKVHLEAGAWDYDDHMPNDYCKSCRQNCYSHLNQEELIKFYKKRGYEKYYLNHLMKRL